MIGLLCFVVAVLASPFKSKIRLEAGNAALSIRKNHPGGSNNQIDARHQLLFHHLGYCLT